MQTTKSLPQLSSQFVKEGFSLSADGTKVLFTVAPSKAERVESIGLRCIAEEFDLKDEAQENLSRIKSYELMDYIWVRAVVAHAGGSQPLYICEHHQGNVFAFPASILSSQRPFLALLLENGANVICDQNNYMRIQLYFRLQTQQAPRAVRNDYFGWSEHHFGTQWGYIYKEGHPNYFCGDGVFNPLPAVSNRALKYWQDNIAQYALTNTLSTLAVGAAFAAPLMRLLHVHTGFGVHIFGASSSGKSTIARIANSVFNRSPILQSWDSTKAYIQQQALRHNDLLLCMDEMSNSTNPSTVYQVLYNLSEGQSRGRCNNVGAACDRFTWLVTLFSTGEESTPQFLSSHHCKIAAGQLVRVLNFPAGNQAFNHVPSWLKNSEALADHLSQALRARQDCLGVAGQEFVWHLLNEPTNGIEREFDATKERIRNWIGVDTLSNQAKRVVNNLALVFFALEKAMEFGVIHQLRSQVETQHMKETILAMLNEYFSGAGYEDNASVRDVVNTLQENHLRKFVDFNELQYPQEIWGYKDDNYLFMFPKSFEKAFCQKKTKNVVASALKDKGLLVFSEGRSTKTVRVDGIKYRFYVFDKKVLLSGE